jgi:quercetin dioxygenase-like cupin family protein
MRKDSVRRAPDFETPESRNVGWALLPRRASSACNMPIVVQRFEQGGDFEDHSHDLEQFFYVTAGRMEMTIGGEMAVYEQGDFVTVGRDVSHSGRNLADGESELFVVDYWPADSEDRIGLD